MSPFSLYHDKNLMICGIYGIALGDLRPQGNISLSSSEQEIISNSGSSKNKTIYSTCLNDTNVMTIHFFLIIDESQLS